MRLRTNHCFSVIVDQWFGVVWLSLCGTVAMNFAVIFFGNGPRVSFDYELGARWTEDRWQFHQFLLWVCGRKLQVVATKFCYSANGRGVCLFFFLFAVDPNDITNINSRLNAWDFTEIHSFNNFDVLIRKQNGCYSAFIEYIITECGWHAMKWIATILRTCEKWSKLNQLQYSKVCMHCIWLLYNQMTSRFRN